MDIDTMKRKTVPKFIKFFDAFIDGGEKYYIEFDEITQMIEALGQEDYESFTEKEKAKSDKALEFLNEFVAVKSAVEFIIVMYAQDLLDQLDRRFTGDDGEHPTKDLDGAMQSLKAWCAILPKSAEEFINKMASEPKELADNFRELKNTLKQTMRAAVDQLPYLIVQETDNIKEIKAVLSPFYKRRIK